MKKPATKRAVPVPEEITEIVEILEASLQPPSRESVIAALYAQIASEKDTGGMDLRGVPNARLMLFAAKIVQAAPETAFAS